MPRGWLPSTLDLLHTSLHLWCRTAGAVYRWLPSFQAKTTSALKKSSWHRKMLRSSLSLENMCSRLQHGTQADHRSPYVKCEKGDGLFVWPYASHAAGSACAAARISDACSGIMRPLACGQTCCIHLR